MTQMKGQMGRLLPGLRHAFTPATTFQMDSRDKTIYPRAMFRTGAQMAILVLLTGMFVLWTTQTGPVKAFEEILQGRLERLDARGRELGAAKGLISRPSPAPVFLVAINDNS